jgi:hypothetical protein
VIALIVDGIERGRGEPFEVLICNIPDANFAEFTFHALG